MERAWFLQTRRLARPLDEYHENVVYALLYMDDEIEDELTGIQREYEEWVQEQEKTLGQRVSPHRRTQFDPDKPIITGDPVVDEWERQIARGELPDWMVK